MGDNETEKWAVSTFATEEPNSQIDALKFKWLFSHPFYGEPQPCAL